MDSEFTEDQGLLRDTVRRFLSDQAPVTPYVRAMFDDPGGFDIGVWRGLAALGVTGLAVPEDFGGSATDDDGTIELGVVLEELGRMVHPGPFLSSAVGAVSFVRGAGSADDLATYLPGFADGSIIGTVALPGAAPTFEAMAIDEGEWRVSGSATWVADATAADVVFVVATTDQGVCAFGIDTDQPGLSVEAVETVDGTRRFGTVTALAAHARALDGTAGLDTAIGRTRDLVNVGLVMDGIGAASRALEIAVDYAKEREQFGVAIGTFQAVQHLCADMLRDLETARAGAYYALWAADHAGAAEFHRAATMAKAYSSDTLVGIAASTIQILGGVGFTWEHDAHLYYKRLLTLQQVGGTTPEHLEELASIILA